MRLLNVPKCFITLAALMILGGCVTTPQPLPVEVVAQINRVGVVADVGTVFFRKYTGITVFGNEYEEKILQAGI